MNHKSTVIGLAVLFLALLGGAGYLYMQNNPAEVQNESTESVTTSEQASELPANDSSDAAGTSLEGSAGAGQNDTPMNSDDTSEQSSNYTIEMSNFEFSIEEIKAKPGETITVELTNSGGTHDFVIDELNVQSDVTNTGGNALVTFTIPEDAAGKTFAYYCSIGSHRAQGMEGTLTIASN